MRTIKETPAFFSNYLKKEKPENWGKLDVVIKQQLRNHIKTEEQFNVDAYTQQNLKTEHIDHYKRKAGHFFPQLCFDYENLFVANHNAAYGASYKDKIVKKEDYEIMYNPALNIDKFKFSSDGSISPLDANDSKAKKTIEIFNLNDIVLKRRRQDIFRSADDMSKEIDKDEIISLFDYEFHSGVVFLLG